MHRILILTLVCGLVACGNDSERSFSVQKQAAQTAQHLPAELIQLVPADASVFFYVRSFDAIQSMWHKLGEMGEGAPPVDPVATIALQGGFDPTQVNRDRPAAMAISFPAGRPMPMPTYILPVKDAKWVASSYQRGTSAVRGGYVALSMSPDYKPGGRARLTKSVPDGDLVVRLDLDKLFRDHREEVLGLIGMAQAGAMQSSVRDGVDSSQVLGDVFGKLRAAVASAETLDLSVGMKQAVFSAEFAFTVKKGSSLANSGDASRLRELAAHLPRDYPAVLLFELDVKSWMEMAHPMMVSASAKMPEAQRAEFLQTMEGLDGSLQNLGNDWMVGFSVDADGFHVAGANTASDARAYVNQYLALARGKAMDALGITLKDEGERKTGNAMLRRLRLQFDSKKFLGGVEPPAALTALFGGAVCDLASTEDRLLVAWDKKPGIAERMLESRSPPKALQEVLDRIPGDLSFLLRVELRPFLRGFADFARTFEHNKPIPQIPEGDAAALTVYATRHDRTHRLGVRFDTEELGAVIHDMKGD